MWRESDESRKFGENIYYSNWDNEFFQMDCFLLVHPVYMLHYCISEGGIC